MTKSVKNTITIADRTHRTTAKRLTPFFPSLDSSVFLALMRKVQTRFEALHEEVNSQLALRPYASVMELAQSVIPQDDSALQWAPMGSGLTSDPDATLELLFERFVMKHDETSTVHRRNDEQVWKNFSRELEQQQVLKHFQPQTFTTADDEIKFDRAWKNGIWHCLAPVSFDLASPESIRDKAHKWLGQITSVDSADLKLYFLVGEPSQADLKPVYQSALNILKKASSSAEVFTETDAASLSLRLAAQVAQHEANARMPERREALAFQPPLPRLIWRPASRSSRIPIWVIFTPAPAPSSQQTPPHAERPLP